MRFEYASVLRGEPVTVHISKMKSYEDEAPYIEFEVIDEEGEEVELTDEEVEEFLMDIIEFLDNEAEMERGYYEDQEDIIRRGGRG